MEQPKFEILIWGITDDGLRDVYVRGAELLEPDGTGVDETSLSTFATALEEPYGAS